MKTIDGVSHMTQQVQRDRHLGQTRTTVEVLGVKIDVIQLDQLLDTIMQTVADQDRRRALLAYANVHTLNLAWDQPWFRAFLNQSDVVFCDGFGVKWGACLLGYHLPERFTPPDWIPALAERCCRERRSLFLLGAAPGVAEQVATVLVAQFPGLHIAGTHHGYFDHSPGSAGTEEVARLINCARPDILLLGLGMPLQERWLWQNWGRLNVRVVLPVGAALDYLAGNVPRGPRWMTNHGLEWLSRLVIEPGRLWRRYLIGNPLFLLRIVRQRLGWLPAREDSHAPPRTRLR